MDVFVAHQNRGRGFSSNQRTCLNNITMFFLNPEMSFLIKITYLMVFSLIKKINLFTEFFCPSK